ncbi:MAG: L-threonylcarbamoyladenylate synthase [Nitrospirota bacterium]
MLVIKVSKTNKDEVLQKAIDLLKKGGIIAYPAETFYGIGAKFDMEKSLERIYEIKKRPKMKAMPLIIGDRRLLSVVAASVTDIAIYLMEKFWPGPLTLIFQAKEGLSKYIAGDTNKVAIRIPGKSFALDLAKIIDFPITATSANLSGMPPAKDARTVMRYFEDDMDLLVDSGLTPGGLPSTIVDVTEVKITIIREGAVSKESLREFLNGSI